MPTTRVQQEHLEKLAWMEAMLDTSIEAYESHRSALENIYAQLVKWKQSSPQGCIHIGSAEAKQLLKDIGDVLAHCALQLKPMERTVPAAVPSVSQRERSPGDASLFLDSLSNASNRNRRQNMAVPAPSQSPGTPPAATLQQHHQQISRSNSAFASRMKESRRHQSLSPVLQYSSSHVPVSADEGVAPAPRRAFTTRTLATQDASRLSLPSKAIEPRTRTALLNKEAMQQQSTAPHAQSRSSAQPSHRTGVALTPWPIMTNGHQTSGGAATSPAETNQSSPTPPSAQLRAEENHNELPATQYRSYKMTGEPLMPSPERHAAAVALEKRLVVEQGDCNGARFGPSTASLATSPSSSSSLARPQQSAQQRQGYWREDQNTASAQGSPPTVEGNNNSRGPSIGDAVRAVLHSKDQQASDAPAAVEGQPVVAATADTLPSPHTEKTDDTPINSLVQSAHSGTAGNETSRRMNESQVGGSMGLVPTPSAASQRAYSEAPLLMQPLAEHRRLRTSTPRRVTLRNQDSKQVQDAVYHRRTGSLVRPPVRADPVETILYMKKEDMLLQERRERELKALHYDPRKHDSGEAQTMLITTNEAGGQLIEGNSEAHRVEAPALTAVEEQLMTEHTILSTQLEKMHMEITTAMAHHREWGHEQRYMQLRTRMARVVKDLKKVESELAVVRRIDQTSRLQSPAKKLFDTHVTHT